jgi:kynurenine formamidase
VVQRFSSRLLREPRQEGELGIRAQHAGVDVDELVIDRVADDYQPFAGHAAPSCEATEGSAMTDGQDTNVNYVPGGAPRLAEAEFRELYARLRAQVPWGPEDRRGALNYLTPAEVVAAQAEVRLGRTVSLAAPVDNHVTPDNPSPSQHQLTQTGSTAAARGLSFAMDRIAMNVHGNADTHIDALCHVIYDGELYNGVPASVVTETGAAELSIDLARDGIVGRGVLLDVPRCRGVPWLEPGDHVTAADLAAAERDQGVRAGPGDLVLVRIGHRRRREARGPWDAARSRAGLHPTVVPYLAERRVAVLGSDGNNDTAPSVVDGVDFPVHVLAINALGMHLLDYLQLEDLVPFCEQAGRWSFLCVIAPLRLPQGTGSPVNPIAII